MYTPSWAYYAYRLPNGSLWQQHCLGSAGKPVGFAELLMVINGLLDNVLEGTFKLDQKLDFITKGLSFKGMVSFNSGILVQGTKVTGTGLQPSVHTIPMVLILKSEQSLFP